MRQFPDQEPGPPDCRSATRYLLHVVARHRASMFLALGYGIVCTVAQSLVPLAVGEGVDDGLIARDETSLITWSAVVMGLGLVQAVTGTLRDRASATNRFGATYLTQQWVGRQAAALGAALPERVAASDVVMVGAADITRIGTALESTARGSGAIVSIFVVAGIMLTASWQLGLIVLAVVPAMAWIIAALLRPLHGRQQEVRARQSALTGLAVDIVDGLRVLRGVGGDQLYGARYRAQSQQVMGAAVALAEVEAWITAARLLMPGLLVAVIVWLGAWYVDHGEMEPGLLVAYYGFAVFLAAQLQRVTGMIDQMTRALVASGQVVRVLSLTPRPDTGTRPLTGPDGGWDLSDPESGVFVRARTVAGIACASPHDAHLLAGRLGRYTESAAQYGGVALSDLPLDEVRRRIMVLDDGARLFSGPLRGELDPHGRTAGNDALLRSAVEDASARDVIDALDRGLDSEVVGAGREFSGGQQQRLKLARALVADPDVLILVEPTSAVDAHTESRIAHSLGANRNRRTTVVLTTSPIVLGQTETVSFVDGGKVAAVGRHEDLLADPRYRAVVSRDAS